MGTFLLRLLADKYIKDSPPSVIKYFGHLPSYEWLVEDRLGNPWDRLDTQTKIKKERTAEIDATLRKHNLIDDMFLAHIHILLQVSKDYFTAAGLAQKDKDIIWPDPLSQEQILELYHNDFTDSASVFPYFKNHFFSYFNSYWSSIQFEKIVIVEFPADKLWLPQLLLFYKHYWSERAKNSIWKNWLLKNKEDHHYTIQRFHNVINDRAVVDNDRAVVDYNIEAKVHQLILKNNIIKIDMYDLIFNQNVSQLSQISSDFNELDNSIVSLLNLAKSHINEICGMFDLDPSLTKTSELKTSKLIDACEMIKSRLDPAGTNLV